MGYSGIDVHKKQSQICILTEAGELVYIRIRTERGRFDTALGDLPKVNTRLEASTENAWVMPRRKEMEHVV